MDIIDLNTYLDRETIRTEKKRIDLFIGVIMVALLMNLIVQNFFVDPESKALFNPKTVASIFLIGFFGLIIFGISRYFVSQFGKRNCRMPKSYQWYTVFIETFLPAFWLVMVTVSEETAAFLDSPVIFLFFVMIIISSLHLDFRLSVSIGLVIGLFHSGFAYWAQVNYPTPFNLPMVAYHIRSVMLILGGVCAGFVALELKKRLITSFRYMSEKRDIEMLFSQQVSKEVMEALREKQDFTASHEVTILFLDIRDFTLRIQEMTPHEVNRFQNQFFSPIIEIINKYKGVTNQVLGDGLMASFGAPIKDENHAHCAFLAINDIFAFLSEFQRLNPEYFDLRIGVGAHSGEVIMGNIGTGERKQFSISGIPVNIASRIEQLNKEYNTSILISRTFYEHVKNHIDKPVTSLGLIKIKGFEKEVEIIRVATNMDMELERIAQQSGMK